MGALTPREGERLPRWRQLKNASLGLVGLAGRTLAAVFILTVGAIVIPVSLAIAFVLEAPLHCALLAYLIYLLYVG